jgi:RNA polymerase sigma-70 factor (ECF subfamily)
MASLDEQIAAGIRRGDRDAEREFCERFQPRVAAIARRRRVLVHECADVTQEVLIDAIRQIRSGKFRGDASFATWLRPIIAGKIADYFRRIPRGLQVSLEAIADQELVSATRFSQEDVFWVRQALERLSVEDQFILRLHEYQQLTLEEIGRLIGLKKSAVADRVKAARNNFRVALRGGNPKHFTRLKG